jgi:hypothetical protein
MPILKFSILTCAIYLGIVFLVELGTIVFARFCGGIIIGGRPWGVGLIFAFVWLLSYSVAWRVLRFPPILR